jgi:hypothetical protein
MDTGTPQARQNLCIFQKYKDGLAGLGMIPEEFSHEPNSVCKSTRMEVKLFSQQRRPE